RGDAYRELRQWDKAVADYNQAIEREAPGDWPWLQRGDARAALKQWVAAADDYTKALELRPERWYTWQRRGDARAALKQWAAAEEDYTKALEWQGKLLGSARRFDVRDFLGELARAARTPPADLW